MEKLSRKERKQRIANIKNDVRILYSDLLHKEFVVKFKKTNHEPLPRESVIEALSNVTTGIVGQHLVIAEFMPKSQYKDLVLDIGMQVAEELNQRMQNDS